MGPHRARLLCADLRCEAQRLAKRVFVHRVQAHPGAALTAPGAALRCERTGVALHESLLLLRCDLHHAVPVVRMKRREDPPVGPEVRMPHVGPLARILHPEGDTAEVVGRLPGSLVPGP